MMKLDGDVTKFEVHQGFNFSTIELLREALLLMPQAKKGRFHIWAEKARWHIAHADAIFSKKPE